MRFNLVQDCPVSYYDEDRVEIGDNVHLGKFKTGEDSYIEIGSHVRIGDYVNIRVDGNLIIESGVTLHNHVSIIGSGDCTIKSGSWIAQYTHLDCEGGLEIGRECCIGFNCQIWSHVVRAPELPNMRFHSRKKTVLEDRVWLMGGLTTVSPGVTLGEGCVIFSNSVVSHDTLPNKVYSGIPAKLMERYDSPYVS
jgi:acetyltransferase-like isoleucine patch superfamily enzyme